MVVKVDGLPRAGPLVLTLPLSRGGDAFPLNHVRSRSWHSGCIANARRHFWLALVASGRCHAHALDPCSNGELIGALCRAGWGGHRGHFHCEQFSPRFVVDFIFSILGDHTSPYFSNFLQRSKFLQNPFKKFLQRSKFLQFADDGRQSAEAEQRRQTARHDLPPRRC